MVAPEYIVGDFEQLEFEKESFDAIGLVYAHFPADKKSVFHKKLNRCLKPGGVVILEAFGKDHLRLRQLDRKVGGPEDIDMLYSPEELIADFEDYEIQVSEKAEISAERKKVSQWKRVRDQVCGEEAD